MLASYRPCPFIQDGQKDPPDSKAVKTDSRGHDINDGINGAHLMEMDMFRIRSVGFGFRLRQYPEDLSGQDPGAFCHVTTVQNSTDVSHMAMGMMMVMPVPVFMGIRVAVSVLMDMPVFMRIRMAMPILMDMPVFMGSGMGMFMRAAFFMAVRMAFLMSVLMAVQIFHIMVMVFMGPVQDHIEVTAVQAGFADTADHRFKAGIDLPDAVCRLLQGLSVRAQIQHGCHEHVTADAGTAFQI